MELRPSVLAILINALLLFSPLRSAADGAVQGGGERDEDEGLLKGRSVRHVISLCLQTVVVVVCT